MGKKKDQFTCMKICRKDFIEGLESVMGICDAKQIPILGTVLLDARQDHVRLSATNLEMRVSVKISAELEPGSEAFSAAISAKRIFGALRQIDDEKVIFSTHCPKGVFKINFSNGSSETHTLEADDFPLAAELDKKKTVSFSISETNLKTGLKRVMFSASRDDSRKVLNGILFKTGKKGLELVATDGKRLSLTVAPVISDIENPGEIEAILPRESAEMLCSLLDIERDLTLRMDFDGSLMSFDCNRFVMTSKVIEATFPNYKQIIPPEFANWISAPVGGMKSALGFARQHYEKDSKTAYVEIQRSGKNELRISAHDANIGACEYCIKTEMTIPSGFIAIFNADYLLQYLAAAEIGITDIKYNRSSGVFLFQSGKLEHCIMPIRSGGGKQKTETGSQEEEEKNEDMIRENTEGQGQEETEKNTTEVVNSNEKKMCKKCGKNEAEPAGICLKCAASIMNRKPDKKKADTMKVKMTLQNYAHVCQVALDARAAGCCDCEPECEKINADSCSGRLTQFGNAAACTQESGCSKDCPRLIKD